jgi:hypothetical protein
MFLYFVFIFLINISFCSQHEINLLNDNNNNSIKESHFTIISNEEFKKYNIYNPEKKKFLILKISLSILSLINQTAKGKLIIKLLPLLFPAFKKNNKLKFMVYIKFIIPSIFLYIKAFNDIYKIKSDVDFTLKLNENENKDIEFQKPNDYKSIFIPGGGDIYFKNALCIVSSIIGFPICLCKKYFYFEAKNKGENRISIKWNHLLCKNNRLMVSKKLSDVIKHNYIEREKQSLQQFPISISAHCHGNEILALSIRNLKKQNFKIKNTIFTLIGPMLTNETSKYFSDALHDDEKNKILFILSPFDFFVKNSDITNHILPFSPYNFLNNIIFPHLKSSELELIDIIKKEKKLNNQITQIILYISENNKENKKNLIETSHEDVCFYTFKKNLKECIQYNFTKIFQGKKINLIVSEII